MKTIFMDMFEYPVLNVWEEIMRKEGYALKVHSLLRSALGMRNNLAVKVRYRLGSRNC